MRHGFRFFLPLFLVCALFAQQQSSAPKAAPSSQAGGTDDLYETGRALFEQYAPEDVKRDYEFPSKKQWDEFGVKLQKALEGDSPEALVAMEPEARQALQILEMIPGSEDLAVWLREKIDLIEATKELMKKQALPGQLVSPQRPRPTQPGPQTSPQPTPQLQPKTSKIPNFDYWVTRLHSRPAPEQAAELMPILRRAFIAEGLPPELAWLAEVESTMNPTARNPSGAKGLFQLMPDTAKRYGLSTWMPDERSNPEKSARAAAKLLRSLHERFGEWPLALAAYNAGEGRVRRSLEKKGGKTFEDIASILPVETRLYVPKVLATVKTRAGVSPERLPAPRA